MADKIRNIFVSHHHKDDASVDALADMVSGRGYQFRNSSIRVNPDNRKRLDQKKVSDKTIKRLLRMKMRWASQVIVIIGKETHQREWVNWEIEAAYSLGKPVIGVYENGLKDKVEMPENMDKYGTSVVGWRAESVIGALDGESGFQYPDGTSFPERQGINVVCG